MKLCLGCMEKLDNSENVCPYCGFRERDYRQEAFYLAPGTVIGGRCIVGKVLQYNGFVVSYIGMDAKVGRKLVVEEYLPGDFATRSAGECEVMIYSGDAKEEYEKGLVQFLKEGKAMSTVSDASGIAIVYACYQENATGYLIREFIPGETLKVVLDTGKRYTFSEAKEFFAPVCRSLMAMHKSGVMHYDITPENILLTQGGTGKLIHFGAARFVMAARSTSLSVLVRQGYAPEEQYRSQGKRGSWSDVYGLAAVFYHMLTGIVPEESVERALHDHLKEPSKCGVDIPRSAENALMNALNVYAKDRTKTIDQFCRELEDGNVKRIKVKKKDADKNWRIKKLVVAVSAVAVLAVGAAAVKMKRSEAVSREASGTYMLSPEKLNAVFQKEQGEEEVRDLLVDMGFDAEYIRFFYAYNSDSSQDRIYMTDPADQTLLSETVLDGEAVVYVASSDYISVDSQEMDRLKTKRIDEAQKILQDQYGFKNIRNIENEDYDDGTAGTVYRIEGEFSPKMSCEEPVTIVSARGTRESYEKYVPDLIGCDYDQYVNTGEIKPTRVDVYGPGWGVFKDGAIVETSKKAGEIIVTGGPEGEEFICRVWNQTPDLMELTADNVQAELARIRIDAVEGEAIYSSSVAAGQLIFDNDKLVEGQKEAVVYHRSLGPRPVQEKPKDNQESQQKDDNTPVPAETPQQKDDNTPVPAETPQQNTGTDQTQTQAPRLEEPEAGVDNIEAVLGDE